MKYKRSHRIWSYEEEQFLLDNFGVKRLSYITGKLGRSPESCKNKHYLLTGSHDPVFTCNVLSIKEISEALSVDPKTINKWIKTLNFPSIRLYKHKNDTDIRRRIFVPIDKIWDWVKKHKERINFGNIKLGIITPEPAWLIGTIKKVKKENVIKQSKNWTAEEDSFLFDEYFMKIRNLKDIAKELQRPYSGTQRRLTYLRKKSEESNEFIKIKGQHNRMFLSFCCIEKS